eukprot:3858075-Amphidinium_carterae.1
MPAGLSHTALLGYEGQRSPHHWCGRLPLGAKSLFFHEAMDEQHQQIRTTHGLSRSDNVQEGVEGRAEAR